MGSATKPFASIWPPRSLGALGFPSYYLIEISYPVAAPTATMLSSLAIDCGATPESDGSSPVHHRDACVSSRTFISVAGKRRRQLAGKLVEVVCHPDLPTQS